MGEKESKKEIREVKAIQTGLQSSDKEKVLEAITLSRKHGNQKTFGMMLNCLKDTDEPEVEAAIIQFLFDLKDESSIPLLIEALEDENMKYYHSFLVSAFWQSALDGSEYLDLFIKKAIEGEYMTCLEALTVIENLDSSFPNSQLVECEASLAEAVEMEKEPEKKALLESLREVVANLPEEGE